MLNYSKILKVKITIAKLIYYFIKLVKKEEIITFKKRNIIWTVRINDIVGLSVFLTGGFQNKKFNQFLKIDPNIEVFIDVGANIGSHTINTFNILKKLSSVYSIEPDQENFNILNQNILNNNLDDKVKVFHAYLGESINEDSSSRYPLVSSQQITNEYNGIPGIFNSASSFNLKNLNEIKEHQRCALKIDVDGNELVVLNSLFEFLKYNKPNILVEINKDLLEVKELKKTLDRLKKIGYMVYRKNGKYLDLNSIISRKKNLGDDLILINTIKN